MDILLFSISALVATYSSASALYMRIKRAANPFLDVSGSPLRRFTRWHN